MSKRLIFILIGLLLLVFIVAPLLIPSEDSYSSDEYSGSEEYEDDDDFDIDLKKSKTKSVRSIGGSKSFRSGK